MQLRAFLLACFALVLAAGAARADEVTGTWTGTLEGRGNYYWERSTRVVVPTVDARVVAPNGVRAGAGYLVDVISSASIAQTGSDIDAVFTELRHAGRAEVGKEFDLDGVQVDPGVHATYSTEDDYESWIYGATLDVSFHERTNKLSLGVTRVDDRIFPNNDPTFRRDLQGVTTFLGFERVLTRDLVLTLGYQLGVLEGYLGNAYRRVVFDSGAPVREAPPSLRVRHNASAKLSYFFAPTLTSLHLIYRAYVDSWGIGALTPELRVVQELGPDVLVRGHYRFHTQTAASFWERDGRYSGTGETHVGPTTNDPKLTAFDTHTFGAGFELRLAFLADSFLDFARNAWLDVAVDRYLSDSTFGDGVIATAGGRLPF